MSDEFKNADISETTPSHLYGATDEDFYSADEKTPLHLDGETDEDIDDAHEMTPPHLANADDQGADDDGAPEQIPPHLDSMNDKEEKKSSPRLAVGICICVLVVLGGLVLAIKSKNPKSARPTVTQAKINELQRLTNEAKQTIQQANQLKDEIYKPAPDQPQAQGSGLSRKYQDSPPEIEKSDIQPNNDRGRQEEEAINAVLRESTQVPPPPPPDAIKQADAGNNTATIPMFVYSKTYSGARYTENRPVEAKDTPNQQQAIIQEEINNLRTLVQMMAINPELAAASVMQEAVGNKNPPPAAASEKTQLIYTSHPPVIVNEGEMFEAALVNRLIVNVEPSPVVAALSRDVYDRSGKFVIFPANSRVIGNAQAVNYKGASRLFVSFHRIILPNGLSVNLPQSHSFMKAMDAQGSLGIVSHVNRHWFLQFGSAIMFGVIDGLAGWAQGGNDMAVTSEGYVISRTSQNFDKVLDKMMEQYSSIMPTITVDQGKSMRIYISDDMLVSPWQTISERSYYGARKF